MSPVKTVAVASIHEEDFSLDELTTPELEKLREKVDSTILSKLEKEIHFISFSYEAVDDRSMGQLEFECKTVHGMLAFKGGTIGSDGFMEDGDFVLYPVDAVDSDSQGVEVELDNFCPLFHSNVDTAEAKTEVAKSVLEWAKEYQP
jgi:hypothetical protein